MQFPMRDAMTVDQIALNDEARKYLVRGKYYRFKPQTTATAVPTGGPSVCALEDCTFERGWYIGLVDGCHVFMGKPVNDRRVISVPRGYEHAPNLGEILERLRESYFHVLFIGGESAAILDTNQNH